MLRGILRVVRSFHELSGGGRTFPGLGGTFCRNGSLREVRSATSGKAELALPTLAIAEVPVAELPVRDRLLLWENSQLVKFSVKHDDTRTSEKKDDAAHPETKDPYTRGLAVEK